MNFKVNTFIFYLHYKDTTNLSYMQVFNNYFYQKSKIFFVCYSLLQLFDKYTSLYFK